MVGEEGLLCYFRGGVEWLVRGDGVMRFSEEVRGVGGVVVGGGGCWLRW